MKKQIILLSLIVLLNHCSSSKNESTIDNKYRVISKKGINLRKNPDKSGEIICLIPINEEVIVINKSEKNDTIDGINSPWYNITYKSYNGWVFGGYIQKTNPITKLYLCDDGQYYLTFDRNIITENEMDELILFCPNYYLSYDLPLSALAERQVELEYNDKINLISMTTSDPQFLELHNKKLIEEQKIINKLKSWNKYNLNTLANEYVKVMEGEYWLDKMILDYFSSDDINKLKNKYQNIDSEIIAEDIILKIQQESDPLRRFKLVSHEFHNRINDKLPRRPIDHKFVDSLWSKFISEYKIIEKKIEDVP